VCTVAGSCIHYKVPILEGMAAPPAVVWRGWQQLVGVLVARGESTHAAVAARPIPCCSSGSISWPPPIGAKAAGYNRLWIYLWLLSMSMCARMCSW
jgi:hypothetical protein